MRPAIWLLSLLLTLPSCRSFERADPPLPTASAPLPVAPRGATPPTAPSEPRTTVDSTPLDQATEAADRALSLVERHRYILNSEGDREAR